MFLNNLITAIKSEPLFPQGKKEATTLPTKSKPSHSHNIPSNKANNSKPVEEKKEIQPSKPEPKEIVEIVEEKRPKKPQHLNNNINNNLPDFELVEYDENEPYSEDEWMMILSKSELIQPEQSRLHASLHKGVPKELRKRIWLYIANVEENRALHLGKGIIYESLLKEECAVLYRIEKDIPRTFPNHEFFNENRKDRLQHLTNVLKAYAVFDPEVGYTQGMNFLVGTLIYYMHLERTEKDYFVVDPDLESDVFWVLVHIMYKKDWRNLYKDNTPKLCVLLDKLEEKIKVELPKLYYLFDEHALIPACFSQYYLTMMFYNSPLKFAKRVLDMFLVDGEDIISDLIFKMLSLCHDEILRKQGVEELYPFLRSQLVQFTLTNYAKEFPNLVSEVNSITSLN